MLKIMGAEEEVEAAIAVIQDLRMLRRKGGSLTQQEFKLAVRQASTAAKRPAKARGDKGATESRGFDRPISEIFLDDIPLPLKRRRLSPITGGQKTYIEMIRKKDIVFGIGPAGTGKTYLAVAMAVSALISGKVSRIILCRPAVEAGEKLGFLPGDMKEKLDPYVRPLYDALYEMMEAERIRQALETGVIEIAPLAFMRGRTLNNSFVILDEAQNTSPEQMKMFLTRLGFESKAVITGDVTQVDLPRGTKSGLVHVQEVLAKVDDIAFVRFGQKDVVRHDLVMKIVEAYEKFDDASEGKKKSRVRDLD
ncbi:AAA family ATPase [bacterium]|nr:AAA family ATPase [bacterium]